MVGAQVPVFQWGVQPMSALLCHKRFWASVSSSTVRHKGVLVARQVCPIHPTPKTPQSKTLQEEAFSGDGGRGWAVSLLPLQLGVDHPRDLVPSFSQKRRPGACCFPAWRGLHWLPKSRGACGCEKVWAAPRSGLPACSAPGLSVPEQDGISLEPG